MPYQQPNFPLLSPEQADPIGRGLSEGILAHLNSLKAQTEQAKLPYAGLTSLADASSKIAFSNMVAPQALAKLVGNPTFFKSLSPEDQQRLSALATLIPSAAAGGQGYPNVSQLLGVVNQGKGAPQDQGSGGMINALMGLLGQGSAQGGQQQMPPQGMPQQPGIPQPQQPAMQSAPQQPIREPGPGSGVNMSDLVSAPVPEVGTGYPPPKTAAENTADYDAQVAQKVKRTEADQQNKSNSLQTLKDDWAKESDAAYAAKNNMEKFYSLAQKANTGPIAGRVAAWNDVGQQLNQISAEMQNDMTVGLFGSKATNYKEQVVGNTKPNVKMGPEAIKGTAERFISSLGRLQDKSNFQQIAENLGVTDSNKITTLFHNYNVTHPFYDNKNLRPIPENNNPKRYAEFISKQMKGSGLEVPSSPTENTSPAISKRWKMVGGSLVEDK